MAQRCCIAASATKMSLLLRTLALTALVTLFIAQAQAQASPDATPGMVWLNVYHCCAALPTAPWI
jgi:hypothetical protein